MTPHEGQYPRRSAPDDGDNWGIYLLAVVAIGIVGALVLTGNS